MSFGLQNAQATFQHLKNMVVSGLEGCAVFLDDVVVFINTWKEHMAYVSKLFDRLTEAHLPINLAKFEFTLANVTYLGKVLGRGSVQPVETKVTAILQYPVPATKIELQQVPDIVGYSCRFL